jgi:hypothetical protein
MITEIGCNQCGATAKIAEARGWKKIKPYPGVEHHELHVCPKCAPSFTHDYDTTTIVKGKLRKLYDGQAGTAPFSLALYQGDSDQESTIVLFGTEFVVRAFRLRSDTDEMLAIEEEHQPEVDAILALANWDGGCQTTRVAQRADIDEKTDYVFCLVPAARC